MIRERSLDPFPGDDASDGEHLARPTTPATDDDSVKNLDSLFVAFLNLRVNIDGVADFKHERIGTQILVFNGFHVLVNHVFSSNFSPRAGTARL